MKISRFLLFLGFALFFRDDEKDENQRQIEEAETKQIPRRFGVTASGKTRKRGVIKFGRTTTATTTTTTTTTATTFETRKYLRRESQRNRNYTTRIKKKFPPIAIINVLTQKQADNSFVVHI